MKISISFPMLSRDIFRKLEKATEPGQSLGKFVALTSAGQFKETLVEQVDVKVADYYGAADDGYTQECTVPCEMLQPLWDIIGIFPRTGSEVVIKREMLESIFSTIETLSSTLANLTTDITTCRVDRGVVAGNIAREVIKPLRDVVADLDKLLAQKP